VKLGRLILCDFIKLFDKAVFFFDYNDGERKCADVHYSGTETQPKDVGQVAGSIEPIRALSSNLTAPI
jgi:hypothetical protein